jgi:hypothetical protein
LNVSVGIRRVDRLKILAVFSSVQLFRKAVRISPGKFLPIEVLVVLFCLLLRTYFYVDARVLVGTSENLFEQQCILLYLLNYLVATPEVLHLLLLLVSRLLPVWFISLQWLRT